MDRRLIIPPARPSKYINSPDMRDWSLSKITLYEKYHQQHKSHTKKHHVHKIWWVNVTLPNKQIRWYQLPKDLQHAIRFHHHLPEQEEIIDNTLIGALINVPISKYNKDGQVTLTTAIINKAKLRKSTGNPEKITRSQFIKPEYNRWHILRFKKIYTFLRHDYDTANQKRIHQAILKLVPLIKL